MTKPKSTFLAFIIILLSPMAANADLILQDVSTTFMQIQNFEPLGQSFIAEDANVSIAFYFSDFNSSLFPNLTLRMILLEGDGLGGAVVDAVGLLLTPGTFGFVDFDFSSTSLLVGSSYTVLIDAQNARWGVAGQRQNLYAGGRSYDSDGFLFGGDLRFRVTPTVVPEPGTLALLGIGLLGMGAARRRRKA